MGLKFNIVLTAIFVTLAGAMWFYIQYQEQQIVQLKANAVVLEGEVQKQNESINQYLANQKARDEQIATLTKANQEAEREVSQLKNTFSRHNLDNLALSKPALIEKIVNKGTKAVKDELVAITDPDQFDEKTNSPQ